MTAAHHRLTPRALFAALIALALLLCALPAFAQTFPPLTGQVVDNAHLLSAAQTADLTTKLAALEQQSGHQMVVATVPSLEGYEIDDYGYRLGRSWGIGQKKDNDGLLLLIAPTERKVRIEVGYGLEPIVTDALSSVIIQRSILPAFRSGDMAGGIVAGADALVGLLQLPDDQAQARAQQIVASAKKKSRGGVPVSLIFWVIVIGFIVIPSIGHRLSGGGRRYRRGGAPVILWGPGLGGGWGGSSGGGGGFGGGDGGGFSGGGGSFGGGGSSGSW